VPFQWRRAGPQKYSCNAPSPKGHQIAEGGMASGHQQRHRIYNILDQTIEQNIQPHTYVKAFMKSITSFAFCFALWFVHGVSAQEKISPNQAITRNIEPGKSNIYSVSLQDGDYVGASITQSGRIDVIILDPDGSPHRRFSGSSNDEKKRFSFVAEGTGIYSIKVTNASKQSAKYELLVESILSLNDRLQPESWNDPYPSPRIQALRRQIESGRSNTESFWKEVAMRGTPLIEPFGSDNKYSLVTFLWRGRRETRNVLVLGSFQSPRADLENVMHRIAGSDVWYLTLKLPKGARFWYRLSPNDPLTFERPRAAQRGATAQVDPLNPRQWNCPTGADKYQCSSLAELPGAAPQSWTINKAGTAEGRIEEHTIRSEIQKLDRGVAVYTPPGYTSDARPNALLFLFDGEAYPLPNLAMPTTLNNLIVASKIPATVVVLVKNVSGRRLKDLVPNPEFADFMAKELAPWVRARYNVTKDPRQTVVGGLSAGGLAAAYIGLRYPEIFGNVLSQSGAFWWAPDHFLDTEDATTEPNWMAKQFSASPKLPLRFYLDAGTFESDKSGKGGDILEATRHLRDVLLAKGYEVHYQQFVGGHTDLSWRGTLADGLIALLGDR
jgi:enterochelin esterase-like enzyme